MGQRIRRDLLGLAPRAPLPVPAGDPATMLAVDRLTTDGIGLSLLQMMENAGRELATLGRSAMGGEAEGRRGGVRAGSGNKAEGRRPALGLTALRGFSRRAPPREPYQRLIALAAQTEAAVISLDLPSGLD